MNDPKLTQVKRQHREVKLKSSSKWKYLGNAVRSVLVQFFWNYRTSNAPFFVLLPCDIRLVEKSQANLDKSPRYHDKYYSEQKLDLSVVALYWCILWFYLKRTFCGWIFPNDRKGNLIEKWASQAHCWYFYFPPRKERAAVVLTMEIFRTGRVILRNGVRSQGVMREVTIKSLSKYRKNNNIYLWIILILVLSNSAHVSFKNKKLFIVLPFSSEAHPKHCEFKKA